MIAQLYPALAAALLKAQQETMTDNVLGRNVADYIEPKFDTEKKYPGVNISEEELKDVPLLRLKLKNAVIQGI